METTPKWMTPEGLQTLQGGYLLPGETVRDAMMRCAKAIGKDNPDHVAKYFEIIWNGWLGLATPVFSNLGTDRGYAISCFGVDCGDTLWNIGNKVTELMMMAKHGGGVGVNLSRLRGRGAEVKGTGGTSSGVVPWAKIFDSATISTSQGGTRRGNSALYLDVEHPDIEEFLNIRRVTGDPNTRCLNISTAVNISDAFMHKVFTDRNPKSVELWKHILKLRMETGFPYLHFIDNANNQRPQEFKDRNLPIHFSNLCSEIFLPTDPYHSFSCILSSMNLAKWHEWKDTDAVYWAIRFLDGVCDDFLTKARFSPGFENVIRFTEKARALGLGVLGWHSFLQQEQIPFDSFQAMNLNSLIFKHIRERAEEASIALGVEKGIPEWGVAKRNATLMAIAPTVSNSLICGGVSSGIEPWAANIITQDSAKGTFIRRNKELEKLLTKQEDWDQITKDKGSALNVESLTQEQKEVFLTAREINQFAIIRQAASRQKWIDQGQSVNLFFDTKSAGLKYISDVHKMAWEMGMKSLYYCRSGSVLRADLANRTADECKACEG